MVFNPLQKVEDARDAGRLPDKLYHLIVNRFHIIRDGVTRIEKATGMDYPYYYVEPTLVISTSEVEFTQFGILFARTIPVVNQDNRLNVVVQITAPLIAYGLLGSIHAVLAHEFMHYMDLISRIMKMNVISDEISGTLFEGNCKDSDRLLEAGVVFKSDSTLIDHINKKFPEGFRDLRLEDKVVKEWIGTHLPISTVPVDTN
ncbi:MAG: hypothetical protein WA421_09295, partial [Nitrososphaeraceae archaeon]